MAVKEPSLNHWTTRGLPVPPLDRQVSPSKEGPIRRSPKNPQRCPQEHLPGQRAEPPPRSTSPVRMSPFTALFSSPTLSLLGASTVAGKPMRMGAGNSETEISPCPEGKCPRIGALFWPRWWPYIKWRSSKTLNLKRHMHPYVHSGTIYKSQAMETTCMPVNRWMDKEDTVHVHKGILLGPQKRRKWWHLQHHEYTWRLS